MYDCNEQTPKVEYDFKKLKLRIKEVFDTQEAFAEAMGMNYVSLNQRLNNTVDWKLPEIAKACDLLGILWSEIKAYFFTEKVQISCTNEY